MKIDLKRRLTAGIDDECVSTNGALPAASELEVTNFEALIGFTLPEDYRQFLLTVNGGGLNTHNEGNIVYDVTPLLEVVASKTETRDLGVMFSLYEGYTAKRGSRYNSLALTSQYESYCGLEAGGYPFVPPDCVPIADPDGSSYLLLSLAGKYENNVLYYGYNLYDDPSELYGNVRIAGTSFTAFLDGLRAA